MGSKKYPSFYFMDLRYEDSDQAMSAIADLILEGCQDPLFLKLLSSHINPGSQTITGNKFALKRPSKGGSPRKRPRTELIEFLLIHVEFLGENYEHIIDEASRRFRVSRTLCTNALREARNRDPAWLEEFRAVALALRDQGEPEYMPITNWTK